MSKASDTVKKVAIAAVVAAATHPAHKPGWRTTEFWVSLGSAAVALIPMIEGILPPKYAVPVVGFIGAIYTLSRSITKNGGSYLPALTQAANSVPIETDGGEDEAPMPAMPPQLDLDAIAEAAASKALAKLVSKVAN